MADEPTPQSNPEPEPKPELEPQPGGPFTTETIEKDGGETPERK
jgi:hypothetical protein